MIPARPGSPLSVSLCCWPWRSSVPHLEENFLRVLQDRAAGDPMRQEVQGNDLIDEQIAGHLAGAGTPVSMSVVKQLLDNHGYVTRKARKSKARGGCTRPQQAVRGHRPAQSGIPGLG